MTVVDEDEGWLEKNEKKRSSFFAEGQSSVMAPYEDDYCWNKDQDFCHERGRSHEYLAARALITPRRIECHRLGFNHMPYLTAKPGVVGRERRIVEAPVL